MFINTYHQICIFITYELHSLAPMRPAQPDTSLVDTATEIFAVSTPTVPFVMQTDHLSVRLIKLRHLNLLMISEKIPIYDT